MTYFTNDQVFEVSRRFAVRHGRMAWNIRKHPKAFRGKRGPGGPSYLLVKDVPTIQDIKYLSVKVEELGRKVMNIFPSAWVQDAKLT